ncbi:MAG: hypothetical protein IPH94_21605 [Saprospiraceae bacterium]|nr:hypothetical protein [Saprospiraceae bacterium]
MRNSKIAVIFSLFFGLSVTAQKDLSLATKAKVVISDSLLQKYSTNPDFQYIVPKQFSANKSWWEKLRSWKNELIRKFPWMGLKNISHRNYGVGLCGPLCLFFFTNLGFRKKRKKFLGKGINRVGNLYQKVTVEDTFLQEELLMEEKLPTGEAIRWIFLRYLAVRSKGYIQWQPERPIWIITEN